MLTDSGGFRKMFSLADTVKLSTGESPSSLSTTAAKIHWTPEENMRIQELIGADIAMQLDQCAPYPATREFVARAVDHSSVRARRCLAAHNDPTRRSSASQGGMHLDLRLKACDGCARSRTSRWPRAAGARRLSASAAIRGRGSRGHVRDAWARWPGPARTTGRATLWAWATRHARARGARGRRYVRLRAAHPHGRMRHRVSSAGRIFEYGATPNTPATSRRSTPPATAPPAQPHAPTSATSQNEMLGAILLSVHNLHS